MNKQNQIKKNGNMTEGKEWKCILMFSIPLLLGNIFQQLYSAVDGIVVGRVIGEDALAGVGASFPIIFLLVALMMGLGMGSTVLISQFYGANDYENVIRVVDTTYIVNFTAGIVLSILGVLITDPLLLLMKTPAEAFPYASVFLKITFAGLIGMVGYNLTSALLRGLGDSKTPLYFLMISTVINLILLLLFVIPMQMGVAGAALATALAQLCSFLFAVIYLGKTHPLLKMNFKRMRFDKSIFKESIRIGIPSGIQQTLVAVSLIIIQAIINPYGAVTVAAVTAAMRIQQFAVMPIMNINMAMSAFAGQNIGANKLERVSHGFVAALKLSVSIAVILTAICYFFSNQLIGLFNDNTNVIEIGREFLFIVMPFSIPACLMFMCMGVIRGAGDSMATMFISMIALWVVRVPLAFLLPGIMIDFGFPGYQGVFLANGIDWVAGAILAFAYYKSGRWKKKISINRFKNVGMTSIEKISEDPIIEESMKEEILEYEAKIEGGAHGVQ